MSSELFEKLEFHIDHALETIEFLKLEKAQLEEQNKEYRMELEQTKAKQQAWETFMKQMLEKLNSMQPEAAMTEEATQTTNMTETESFAMS
jgi:FtsZ-binding cell division protein ZapB